MKTAEAQIKGNHSPDREPIEGSAISRRRFLGLGAATVVVAANSAMAYRAYDQGVFSDGRGAAFDALDTWQNHTGPKALVAAAVLAASAHNTQPWAFAIFDDRIEVYADPSRRTGANDALGREFHISLGCAVENMVLAGRANGYDPQVVLNPGTGPDLVATVHLPAGRVEQSELYAAIGDRRSNRSEYEAVAVPAADLATMSNLVDESVAPAKLAWLIAETDRRRFADLVVEAAKAHGADEEQSQASFAWWRSSWDDVQKHRDGLNIDGVGLRPLIRTLGSLLPAPTRQSADATFVERTRLQADSAAAIGILTVDDPYALEQQLVGGRLLERLHLQATARDLGFQYMFQITERIDRDREQGRSSPYTEPLGQLAGGAEVLGTFRIGIPTVAARPSPRRTAEEVTR